MNLTGREIIGTTCERIGIVAGRFNEFITSKLLGGALDAFKRHGGDEANIDLAWGSGCF